MLARLFQFGCWMVLLSAIAGCRSGTTPDWRGIQKVAPVDPEKVLGSTIGSGISANYDALDLQPNLELMSFFNAPAYAVTLKDALCLASRNSKLANLIDREREAVRCEAGCVRCVDRFLAGQAAEQRIKSAADAGELLIRLAGTRLQDELILQSLDKIAQLEETIAVAADNGMATAEANNELQEQLIGIKKKQAKIKAGKFELTAKLNLLLGIDSCCPRQIQPDHHFESELGFVDPEQLVVDALSNRPELNSLTQMGSCSMDDECLAILANLDRRLGLVKARPVAKRLLRTREEEQDECCQHLRRGQMQELRRLREELIRQDVLAQVKEVRYHHENLRLENQDLRRLRAEADSIDAVADLDAIDSFMDSIGNFAQQQLAKSRRINSLIEFEVARIRLSQATGSLVMACDTGIVVVGCADQNE